MVITRRQLLARSAAAATGLAIVGQHLPVIAQGTPAASPVPDGSVMLAQASELVTADPSPQYLAIMDQGTYETAHIPGTVRISWQDLSLPDTSEDAVSAWTESTRQLLGVAGIAPDRPIVTYDEGTLFAARGGWQLAYLGYPPSRVLDGGLPAWNEGSGPTETGVPDIFPLEAPLIDAEVRRDLLATKEEVISKLDDPDVLLVDARSSDEYNNGHIPGAVNMLYTDNAIMKDANRYLAPDALRERYADLGMTPEKHAITYCSTGVRGAVAAFAMLLAGFEHVSLYVGSWNEWGADPETPKE